MSGTNIINQSTFSYSKYSIFDINSSITLSSSDWTTVLNINGSGYLKKAGILNNTTTDAFIKITLDEDNIIFFAKCKNTSNGILLTKDWIMKNNSAPATPIYLTSGSNYFVALNSFSTYPLINQNYGFTRLNEPIFFDKSIKIELCGTNGNSFPVNFNAQGGIK